MVAIFENTNCTNQACWRPAFLNMLPTIERFARLSFRHLQGGLRAWSASWDVSVRPNHGVAGRLGPVCGASGGGHVLLWRGLPARAR